MLTGPLSTMDSADRDVLLVLHRSIGEADSDSNTNSDTDEADWDSNTNWDTDAPIKDWHGVDVNDDGRVVKLSLHCDNLKCTLFQGLPYGRDLLRSCDVLDLSQEFVDRK